MSRTDVHTKLRHIDDYYDYYDYRRNFQRPLSKADVENISRAVYNKALDRVVNGTPSDGFERIGTVNLVARSFRAPAPITLSDDDIVFGSYFKDKRYPMNVVHSTDLTYEVSDEGNRATIINTVTNGLREKLAGYYPSYLPRGRYLSGKIPWLIIPDDQTGDTAIFLVAVTFTERQRQVNGKPVAELFYDKPIHDGEYAILTGPRRREEVAKYWEKIEANRDDPYWHNDGPLPYHEEIKHYGRYRDEWFDDTNDRQRARLENLDLVKSFNSDPSSIEDM